MVSYLLKETIGSASDILGPGVGGEEWKQLKYHWQMYFTLGFTGLKEMFNSWAFSTKVGVSQGLGSSPGNHQYGIKFCSVI